MRVCARACVCVCVCARTGACVCVCVRVFVLGEFSNALYIATISWRVSVSMCAVFVCVSVCVCYSIRMLCG